MLKYLVLDTETNGIGTFRPPTQSLVQISWIRENGTEYDYLIKGATAISDSPTYPCKHITVERLNAEGVSFADVWPQLRKDIEDVDVVVIHNASFDMGIILREMSLAKLPRSEREWLRSQKVCCTMKKSENYCALPKTGYAKKWPGFKWPKLEELYTKLFNEAITDRFTLHNSLDDCRVLKLCYEKGQEVGIF